ncbi:MAG: histidine kinase [Deltaproteobacteria bacterium]|nr:histidine kinase [Deltaproteobacteria bacterium]
MHADSHPRRPPRRWRESLYARAALFLALGCGSLMGAVGVLVTLMVDDSVERLLLERTQLASAAGAFVEQRILQQLAHLAHQIPVHDPESWGEPDRWTAYRDALAREYPTCLFSEGVFLTDLEGKVLVGAPDVPEGLQALLDEDQLLAGRPRTVASRQAELAHRPMVVFLQRLEDPLGQPAGYVGGLLQPATNNLLEPLTELARPSRAEIELIDRGGKVVAATRVSDLLSKRDHDRALADSIQRRETLQGRCHSCHGVEEPDRDTDVLAFAPLPTLPLGVAVIQPERMALAPALHLRNRLLLLGTSFIMLFLIFAGLSVRATVAPVKRLTRAVHAAEDHENRISLGPKSRDEIGQLALALESWRGRMVDSVLAMQSEERTLVSRRRLLHRVLRAQEDERARVARELHDTVAQDLAAMRLEIERLTGRVSSEAVLHSLRELEQRASSMLETVRRILLDLRLSVLETMGFVAALQWLLERDPRLKALHGMLELDCPGDEIELEYETSVSLYRIAQEALNNAVLHAGAEHVLVTVRCNESDIELLIEDDGRGFDPGRIVEEASEQGRGLGLIGMSERARLIGGEIAITSSRTEGTTVRVVAPLRAHPLNEEGESA